ncbi:transmembrane protein, putative (macronuclear) [Tetrahymena thermophila SB210]|uniref:Transmembrane protein, putative n=1 Tax=Tetrahymena thermophila (strain SB210) TaxID=312017 RepID=Q22HJ6_TETTS|nr:transmembrane protein, putative [Tetrahymena thermophila SB210]EAR84705.2 transmembrane protein, putative [Tetrahymena thermophila SB210]|eukprot:XP_001032368.2 transmembrane protein, putative [Tetrahymena thermophila SB210]
MIFLIFQQQFNQYQYLMYILLSLFLLFSKINSLSMKSLQKNQFSPFKQMAYSCRYKQGLNNQTLAICNIIAYEQLEKKQQNSLLVDEKKQEEINAFFNYLNIKINQINFQQLITVSDQNENFQNIQRIFSINAVNNEFDENRLDIQNMFQLQKLMEQMHSIAFNNKTNRSDQLLQKISATKLSFEINQEYQINCIFDGQQFIYVHCIIQSKINQQDISQIKSDMQNILFQKFSFKQSQQKQKQQNSLSYDNYKLNIINHNQEDIKNVKKQERILTFQTACQNQNSNCLVCEIQDQCKICKQQYYNYDGKCITDIQLINYSESAVTTIVCLANFLLLSSFTLSIALSCLKAKNLILLNTLFGLSKIFFLNLISVTSSNIKTSRLFEIFKYINPFKILKSTSWVNIPFKSSESQSQINYSFNENSAEGNIILSSSGAMLAIIYLFLTYKIIQLVVKKQNSILEAYKKYICGVFIQLLIISTQVMLIGVILQIVYSCISSQSLSNDSLFALKIVLVIVNSLIVVSILIFLYKQNNNQQIILDYQETISIQDINQNLIQSGCYSATWIQKNYNLSIIFKEVIVIPLLVVSLQSMYLAQLCSIFLVESIYLIVLAYLRPFKESSDNIINIINSIIWLIIYILKLCCLIQIDQIKFSNDSITYSSSQIIQTIKCIEITLVILCLLVLFNIQLAPIVKILNKRKICDSNIPLIKQIDPLRQLQISPFGFERQNPSMFKIREEKLNELKFLQSYKKYRANSRFSLGSIAGIPRISVSSLNPSPVISPYKQSQQSKSRGSEPLNSQFILNALNDTNLNGNSNMNNNQSSNTNFTVFDQSKQKNSILLIDPTQNKESEQKQQIIQINELKEEYNSNSNHNIFSINKNKIPKLQNNQIFSIQLSEIGSINENKSQSLQSSIDSSFLTSNSSDSEKKLQNLY